MKFSYRLSPKERHGKREIMARATFGHANVLTSGTGIFTTPTIFADFIEGDGTATDNRQAGRATRRLLEDLQDCIEGAASRMGAPMSKERLKSTIYDFHTERGTLATEDEDFNLDAANGDKKKTLGELAREYMDVKAPSYQSGKNFMVTMRAVMRFEAYRQMRTPSYMFDVDRVTSSDIEEIERYLKDEHTLAAKYPHFYAKLHASLFPDSKKAVKIVERGRNDVSKHLQLIKAFFSWLNKTGRCDNHPFDNFTIKAEKYGRPFFITIEERNAIANANLSTEHLRTQRDIFIFQCLIGCRVSDLQQLTRGNIIERQDGKVVVEYVPRKTKDESSGAKVRVPLTETAAALVRKYEGMDKDGHLFPCISAQKYNDAIKDIFKESGITRRVQVRNAKSGETESKPLFEVASSHLARRTFIGNMYRKVKDPNIIGKMSGHAEGSKAFARYRDIDDTILDEAISSIE